MKNYILTLLLIVATIAPISANTVSYGLTQHPSTEPPVITLEHGDWFQIKGDEIKMVVGGDELQKIEHEGHSMGHFFNDGTHYVKYEGGLGGKEGKKTIYNYSLWHLDRSSSVIQNKLFTNWEGYFNDNAGEWVFEAIAATSGDELPELRFVNQNQEVAIIKIKIINPEPSSNYFRATK
ncbi:MAG: hypothetical protein K2W99_05140 [Chthoniobacterales bacterium]|nr:hypothetical protein [Chthoniobacterales bacterium]